MKTILLLFIFGIFTVYGFPNNPIDPQAKAGEDVIAIKLTSLVAINQSLNLYSVVPVTVVVTIADCPDYDCSVPGPGCTIQLCIYEGSCLNPPLDCIAYDPDTCSYNIDVRANEGQYLYARLVCSGCSYGNGCKSSTGVVPQGGGTLYINSLELCP